MDPKFNTRDFKLNVSFNPQQLYMPVPIRQRAARDAIAGKRVGAFSNQLLPTPKPLVNDDGDDSNGDDSNCDADDDSDDADESMLKQNETR